MSKILLVITTVLLAAGLVLGTAGIASADEGEGSRGVFGKVDSVEIDADGIGTINLVDGDPIDLNADTTYHIPTFVPPWQTWAELAETEDGQLYVEGATRVAVLLAEPAADRIALKVMVIPDEPVRSHMVGVVVTVEGDTVTLVNKAGKEITITLPEGVEVVEGEFVTLVGKRFAGEARLRAMAAHTINQLTNRLQNHMEAAQGQDDFDHVGAVLERAQERHAEVLDGIKNRLEEQNQVHTRAVEAIQDAIDNAQSNYEEALQKREEIREQVRTGWEDWLAQWSTIEGTVESLDLEAETVTIAPAEGDPVTLNVVSLTLIVKDGRPATLADLAPDDIVRKAVYETESSDAKTIVVNAPKSELAWSKIRGVIESIDLDEQTVTIAPADGDAVTLNVVDSTRIVKDFQLVTIDELEVDDVVTMATYYTDSLEAKNIVVCNPKHLADGDGGSGSGGQGGQA
jgi:hypothetical protein